MSQPRATGATALNQLSSCNVLLCLHSLSAFGFPPGHSTPCDDGPKCTRETKRAITTYPSSNPHHEREDANNPPHVRYATASFKPGKRSGGATLVPVAASRTKPILQSRSEAAASVSKHPRWKHQVETPRSKTAQATRLWAGHFRPLPRQYFRTPRPMRGGVVRPSNPRTSLPSTIEGVRGGGFALEEQALTVRCP